MNNYGSQKKEMRPAAIISIIMVIVFALATVGMAFLPIMEIEISSSASTSLTPSASVYGGSTTPKLGYKASPTLLDVTSFGKYGTPIERIKTPGYIVTSEDGVYSAFLLASEFYKYDTTSIITAAPEKTDGGKMFDTFSTILFFTVIGTAVLAILGKLLISTGFGRGLALAFSLIGFICCSGYMIFIILAMSKANDGSVLKSLLGVSGINFEVKMGLGLILMVAFSFVTFIFSCVANSEASAFRFSSRPSGVQKAPENFNMPVNNNYKPSAPQNNMNQFANNYSQPVPQNNNFGMSNAEMDRFAPPAPPVSPAPPAPFVPPTPAVNAAPSDISVTLKKPSSAGGQIEGLSGAYQSVSIDVPAGEKIIIGRDPNCSNIVVESTSKDVSRAHCEIEFDEQTGLFRVTDTSSNGTFANGNPLVKNQATSLPKGTIISLGKGEIRFKLK